MYVEMEKLFDPAIGRPKDQMLKKEQAIKPRLERQIPYSVQFAFTCSSWTH